MEKVLNEKFIENLSVLLGEENCKKLQIALNEEPTVAIRLNTSKKAELPAWDVTLSSVEWCDTGFYLSERPNFTLSPQLHCGAFYVQEASSMIYRHIVKTLSDDLPLKYADVCAAPGGKTTAVIDVLPYGSLVVANEFVSARAQILKENIQKWGYHNVLVTNSDTSRFSKLKSFFDIMAVDAPCSGEGMMRKDETAVSQWSPALVAQCKKMQREILANIWDALKPGGYLIYSTCTFNREENEENVDFICNELGGESVKFDFPKEWGILSGIMTVHHCYRFMPHSTRGEGLFVSVIRKEGDYVCERVSKSPKSVAKNGYSEIKKWLSLPDEFMLIEDSGRINAIRKSQLNEVETIAKNLKTILTGIELAIVKGKDIIPQHALALSTELREGAFPSVDLDINDAIAYLKRETITLPQSVDRGYVLVKYAGLPLGFVKNLGNRANNLYPQEWRIRIR